MSLRALQRRVKRIEDARKPRPSPFTAWFGSLDVWVEMEILPGVESGALDPDDMILIVAVLRAWEASGAWDVAQSR
jgi:hypothetical protein